MLGVAIIECLLKEINTGIKIMTNWEHSKLPKSSTGKFLTSQVHNTEEENEKINYVYVFI
jgi:hypothetical protein